MLRRIVERYPHHVMMATSRVNEASTGLADVGFAAFRIVRDAEWGCRYLAERRAILPERLERLYAEAHTISDLLAVPQYAALIGERLAQEPLRSLPQTAFALMTEVAVRDVVEREAGILGHGGGETYRWLETLAVTLELRGRTTATTDEVAALPAPTALQCGATRDRLVERSLLRDVPDVTALQTNAIQEALAAQALLETDNPVQTLLDATTAELRGELVFRADLDHTIDLFFEAAPAELWPALRELDELRWARTVRTDASEEEVGDAVTTIWRTYRDRKVWIDRNPGREIRDARSAVERLVRAASDRVRDLRQEWVDATVAEERTLRANGTFFLQQLGWSDDTEDWLVPLLTDADPVVRRHAAMAAVALGDQNGVLMAALEEAYRSDGDELAAESIGSALYNLASADDRARVARLLRENALGWGRLSYLVKDLGLSDALAVLEEGGIQTSEDERMLAELAAAAPLAAWTNDDVRRLVALVVESARRHYREFRERELLEELAAAHPDAALAGVYEGASPQTNWMDLYFLRRVPAKRLRKAAHGVLEQPLQQLLAILEHQRQPLPLPSQPVVRPREEPTLTSRLHDNMFVEETRVRGIPQPVLERFVREVAELDADQQCRLEEAVPAWWPDDVVAAVTIDNGSGTCPDSLPPALAFSEALDLSLDPDRWLEIFASGAIWFFSGAAAWLRRHYPHHLTGAVAAVVAGLASSSRITIALNCLLELDEILADAAATAIINIDADHSIFLLRRFAEAGQLDALRRIAEQACSSVVRRAAQRELAAAGDTAAQRRELQLMCEEIGANPAAYSVQGFDWAANATSEVVPELGELLRVTAARGHGAGDLQRRIQTALAATRSEEALALYDELVSAADVEGASFDRYQRDELARALAQDRVLARLPAELGEVAAWLVARGYRTE